MHEIKEIAYEDLIYPIPESGEEVDALFDVIDYMIENYLIGEHREWYKFMWNILSIKIYIDFTKQIEYENTLVGYRDIDRAIDLIDLAAEDMVIGDTDKFVWQDLKQILMKLCEKN